MFKQMVSCGCKRNQFQLYGKQLTVQAEKFLSFTDSFPVQFSTRLTFPFRGVFFFFFANWTVFNLYFYCSNTLPFFSWQYLCLIPLLNHLSTCDCLQFSPFFISIENCREFLKSQTTLPSVSLRSFFFQCPIFGLLSSDFRASCLELVICFKKVDLKEKILPFHLKQ